MNVTPMQIPEILLIEPDIFCDQRGFFMESFNAKRYAEYGIDMVFVQDNQSRSGKGVLRGLHYQLKQPQAKLVRVVAGSVFDVAVDIRKGSPTFGEWVGMELSAENNRQLFIPTGFAHGFYVLSESADFLYKSSDFYLPESEFGIRWDDPDIGIDWPGGEFVLSERDRALPRLVEMDETLPEYG